MSAACGEQGSVLKKTDFPYPELEVLLDDPARALASLPWFGERARETFVTLPGVICARLSAQEDPALIRSWTYEILERWHHSMDQDLHSADTALWYCHALAALWVLSLEKSPGREELFPDFEERFGPSLRSAIRSIRDGRKLYLRPREHGLLEVLEGHATWLGQRGLFAEVNALWFQARFLNFLWGGEDGLYELEQLAREVLAVGELGADQIFLHRLPLAPSLILKDWNSLRSDLRNLSSHFVSVEKKLEQNTLAAKWPTDEPVRPARESKPSRALTRLWMKELSSA